MDTRTIVRHRTAAPVALDDAGLQRNIADTLPDVDAVHGVVIEAAVLDQDVVCRAGAVGLDVDAALRAGALGVAELRVVDLDTVSVSYIHLTLPTSDLV